MSPIEPIVVREVDLEIRVTTPWGSGDQRIDYTLNSPSGAVDCVHRSIHGPRLGAPNSFRRELFAKLEDLQRGLDVDGEAIFGADLPQELEAIGRDLYDQLFPAELQGIYRDCRDDLTSIMIISDESWIPWEIVRPYGRDDDDFLCLRFELSRWLAGQASLVKGLRVRRLKAVATAADLPEAVEEVEGMERFFNDIAGVAGSFQTGASFQEMSDLMRCHDFDLIHLVGHGDQEDHLPSESAIRLTDRPYRAHHLSGSVNLAAAAHRPFVFFNNCQVGRLSDTLTQVDGWPARWVQRRGCTGYLAPLWAVHDAAARRFSEVFYYHLAAGATLGRSVLEARKRTLAEHGDLMSLLAYSLYGHPNAQILIGDGAADRPLPPLPPPRPLPPPGPAPPPRPPVRRQTPSTPTPRPPVGPPTESAGPGQTPTTPSLGAKPAARRRWVGTGAVSAALLVVVLWALDPLGTDNPTDDTGPFGGGSAGQGTADGDGADKGAGGATPGGGSTPSADSATDSASATTERTEPKPPPPAKPRWPFPIASPQAGKMVILMLDDASGKVDLELARAVQTLLINEVPSLSTSTPQLDAATLRRLLDGDSAIFPAHGQTPWGSERLLVASATRMPLPQSAAHLKSFSLSIQAQVIDSTSGSAIKRAASTQTGIGTSANQALAQASERCLEEILQFLKKETQQ